MKNVAIKFCSAEEARRRAKRFNMEKHMPNNSIFGIDEEIYESFNDCTYSIIRDVGVALAIEFDNEEYTLLTWYVPKIFIDFKEI